MEKTPNKRTKADSLDSPRKKKPKTPKKLTVGAKAMQFFEEAESRVENGVQKMYFKCKVESDSVECGKLICGNSTWNLGSHLLHAHKQFYQKHIGEVNDSILVKRMKLLQNCVSMIVLGGRPFLNLMDEGFQNIIHDQLREFAEANMPLNVNVKSQPHVHEHIENVAQKTKDYIKKIVEKQPLSALLDISPRMHRSFVGIRVQFIQNKKMRSITLGMIELNRAHTADYLAVVVEKCFKSYNISNAQVVSVTIDNGANVLAMVDLLNERLAQKEMEEQSENTTAVTPAKKQLNFTQENNTVAELNDDITDGQIEDILAGDDITDDDAVDLILAGSTAETEADVIDSNTLDHNATLLDTTINTLAVQHEYSNLFTINRMRCIEHTLQLSLKDSIAQLPKRAKNIIGLCKRVTKILRLKSTRNLLSDNGMKFKIPRLEVETRWGSLFLMV